MITHTAIARDVVVLKAGGVKMYIRTSPDLEGRFFRKKAIYCFDKILLSGLFK